MFKLIKKIFNNQVDSTTPTIIYKTASCLGKDKSLDFIPTLIIPKNNKKNILILDDNIEAAEITSLDFNFLFNISSKLKENGIEKLTPKQHEFISKLPNDLFKLLTTLDIDDFNIIIASTEMAAFSVFKAIDVGCKFDYAILDILIGGYNKYDDKFQILDGIDIAYKFQTNGLKTKYLFYSGCSLVENSEETVKFYKLFKDVNFDKLIIMKDRDLYGKRLKLLELLSDGI